MPYIQQEVRIDLYNSEYPPGTAGELNFAVTKIVDQYLRSIGVGYASINEVIGVLECAKLELYRRIAVPYEDKKLKENGEVYTCVTI